VITVHHLDESRSQRILWLLEELDVPYEIAWHWRDGQTRLAPPTLKDIHPLGKSPIITGDGRVVAESGAIVDYIIRHYGNGHLQPATASPEYDDYVQWMHYAEGSARRLSRRVARTLLPSNPRIRGRRSPPVHPVARGITESSIDALRLGRRFPQAETRRTLDHDHADRRQQTHDRPHHHHCRKGCEEVLAASDQHCAQ
jgi:hypothetical protein